MKKDMVGHTCLHCNNGVYMHCTVPNAVMCSNCCTYVPRFQTPEYTFVSDQRRKANSKAVEKLHRWRDEYTEVSALIREAKIEPRQNTYLRALRMYAEHLMWKRDEIKGELIDTSYKWV